MKALGRAIRRDSAQLPKDLAYEQTCYERREYRHQLTLDPASPYEFRYRRSRRQALSNGVYQRELFCWIVFRGERVGALHLWQFETRPLIDDDAFFDAMDECSARTAELGEVLVTAWPEGVYEVFDFGPVIEFRLAWVAPAHSGRVPWGAAALALIEREFADFSILLLKAFPVEYSGRATGHIRRLTHRQRAMRRYYQRLLAVAPMPGGWGREGWMWRRHARLERAVPRPVAVRLSGSGSSHLRKAVEPGVRAR
jgi:hypothetical protein